MTRILAGVTEFCIPGVTIFPILTFNPAPVFFLLDRSEPGDKTVPCRDAPGFPAEWAGEPFQCGRQRGHAGDHVRGHAASEELRQVILSKKSWSAS